MRVETEDAAGGRVIYSVSWAAEASWEWETKGFGQGNDMDRKMAPFLS